jgi:hypothetical protein
MQAQQVFLLFCPHSWHGPRYALIGQVVELSWCNILKADECCCWSRVEHAQAAGTSGCAGFLAVLVNEHVSESQAVVTDPILDGQQCNDE